MKWLQFLTPIKSLDARQAREYLGKIERVTVLDVRQPKEYMQGHIAGAKLVPLGELGDRWKEIDPDQPVLVYCAIGGRSRVGAQLLAGKGHPEVLNLAGGFKAWEGRIALGDAETGLQVFHGVEDTGRAFEIAYGMELALGLFYRQMSDESEDSKMVKVMDTLAAFEDGHRRALENRAKEMNLKGLDLKAIESGELEGGLTTERYLSLLGADTKDPIDMLSFAMSIEAQAMDLYTRAAERAEGKLQEFFGGMALEEKKHLAQLSALMDRTAEGVANG